MVAALPLVPETRVRMLLVGIKAGRVEDYSFRDFVEGSFALMEYFTTFDCFTSICIIMDLANASFGHYKKMQPMSDFYRIQQALVVSKHRQLNQYRIIDYLILRPMR